MGVKTSFTTPNLDHAFAEGSCSFDAASKNFTLSSWGAWPQAMKELPCRINLAARVLTPWQILNSEKEYSLLNSLLVPVWAKDCLRWLDNGKVEMRFSPSVTLPLIIFSHPDGSMSGTMNFPLTAEGCGMLPPSGAFAQPVAMEGGQTALFRTMFESFWQTAEPNRLDELKRQLEFLATPQPASFLYYKTCQKLLGNSDDEESSLRSEYGFFDSLVWKKLFPFQKDGVRSVIAKLEKYNGCILADSVGLGKTYEALAVIKYYELLNEKVLVLCPKRLNGNWSLFNQSHNKRNPIGADKLDYLIANHSDLQRTKGKVGGVDIKNVKWGNFGLVVIDESHNFRNTGKRYTELMERIIKQGGRTKVLLLSATPVNNRVKDLQHQIAFITRGVDNAFEKHGISNIDFTCRIAQRSFNQWLDLDPAERALVSPLSQLGADYIRLLDMLTIARSRSHIATYYSAGDSGMQNFPKRLAPKNYCPQFASDDEIVAINEEIKSFTMAAYQPLHYIREELREEYDERFSQDTGRNNARFLQRERDEQVATLIRVNLLKRMESSLFSYAETLKRVREAAEQLIRQLDRGELQAASIEDVLDDTEDAEVVEAYEVGRGNVRVRFEDVDAVRWRQDLEDDIRKVDKLFEQCRCINEEDVKLSKLREIILEKLQTPLNPGNRKVIVFTSFADTANYLYDHLAQDMLGQGVHSALVTGSACRSNLEGVDSKQEDLLSYFSPRSRECGLEESGGRQIDLLIATDCVSEGQNLQDCDFLVNYDIHWNPVRIIQRFGRIDRLGSTNSCIQLVNFWPCEDLDSYINLEQRVRGRMTLLNVNASGDDNVLLKERREQEDQNLSKEERDELYELDFRSKQLKRLQQEVVELEDINGGLSLTDLSLQAFRRDLVNFEEAQAKGGQKNVVKSLPSYLIGVVPAQEGLNPGAFFCLKAHGELPGLKEYPLLPYFLVYVDVEGRMEPGFSQVRACLDLLKKAAFHADAVDENALRTFNAQTRNGRSMESYTRLLQAAVSAVTEQEVESRAESVFEEGATLIGCNAGVRGVDKVEVVAMLAVVES